MIINQDALSPFRYLILDFISDHPKGIPSIEVTRYIMSLTPSTSELTPASVYITINRLSKMGYIDSLSKHNFTDNVPKQKLHFLLPEGRKILDISAEIYAHPHSEILN